MFNSCARHRHSLKPFWNWNSWGMIAGWVRFLVPSALRPTEDKVEGVIHSAVCNEPWQGHWSLIIFHWLCFVCLSAVCYGKFTPCLTSAPSPIRKLIGVFSSLWIKAVKVYVPPASSADVCSAKEELSWEDSSHKSLRDHFIFWFLAIAIPVFTSTFSSVVFPYCLHDTCQLVSICMASCCSSGSFIIIVILLLGKY